MVGKLSHCNTQPEDFSSDKYKNHWGIAVDVHQNIAPGSVDVEEVGTARAKGQGSEAVGLSGIFPVVSAAFLELLYWISVSLCVFWFRKVSNLFRGFERGL